MEIFTNLSSNICNFLFIKKVPKPFVGKRNQNDRIVLLTYVHEGKKSVGLWKSGPGKPDP